MKIRIGGVSFLGSEVWWALKNVRWCPGGPRFYGGVDARPKLFETRKLAEEHRKSDPHLKKRTKVVRVRLTFKV